MREFRREVAKKQEGTRLDVYLHRAGTGLSRSQIERLIKEGKVLVNGEPKTKPGYRVRAGDVIEATYELPEPFRLLPEEIPLKIIYEDEDIIVVDKPPGMVVHPARGNVRGTLVNALLGRFGELPEVGDRTRPGVVHRLDKDTSGLIVVAKSQRAVRSLAGQIALKEARRIYWAVVWGRMPTREGEIEAPIGRHPIDRKRMAITPFGSRPALTKYRTLREFGDLASLLEVELFTGRTHQIRVHMEWFGHPVVGDPVYSGREARAIFKAVPPERRDLVREALGIMKRQALHARRLVLRHPGTGQEMAFESPLPEDIDALIDFLEEAADRIASRCPPTA